MTPLRVSVVASLAALVLLVIILELIRSRRLQERYAVLWLITGVTMLVLAIWRDGLARIADLVGIAYPPSALFVIVSLFILAVLLHYSTVISQLSDQNKILAQRLALLERDLEEAASMTKERGPTTRRAHHRPRMSHALCNGVVNASSPLPIRRRSCHAFARRAD